MRPCFYSLFICFFTGILSCLSIAVRAQDSYYVEEPKRFYGGPVIGANFTQVDGDEIAGYNKVGLNVGGIVYTQFTTKIAASIEILYSQKGSRTTKPQPLVSGLYIDYYNIVLNYAEIPVMINYFDKHKSNLGIGLSYSRLATSKESLTTIPAQAFNAEDFPFKKSDINLLFGGSLHMWKGFFLNGRFQYSLASIRDKIPTSTDRVGQYNNLWTIRLMYLFM